MAIIKHHDAGQEVLQKHRKRRKGFKYGSKIRDLICGEKRKNRGIKP